MTASQVSNLDHRYGKAIEPDGFDLREAIERHVCRPPEKSHPNHCAHCYYPWPCPTVTLYRWLLRFAEAVDTRLGSVRFAVGTTDPEKTWCANAAVGLAREVLSEVGNG